MTLPQSAPAKTFSQRWQEFLSGLNMNRTAPTDKNYDPEYEEPLSRNLLDAGKIPNSLDLEGSEAQIGYTRETADLNRQRGFSMESLANRLADQGILHSGINIGEQGKIGESYQRSSDEAASRLGRGQTQREGQFTDTTSEFGNELGILQGASSRRMGVRQAEAARVAAEAEAARQAQEAAQRALAEQANAQANLPVAPVNPPASQFPNTPEAEAWNNSGAGSNLPPSVTDPNGLVRLPERRIEEYDPTRVGPSSPTIIPPVTEHSQPMLPPELVNLIGKQDIPIPTGGTDSIQDALMELKKKFDAQQASEKQAQAVVKPIQELSLPTQQPKEAYIPPNIIQPPQPSVQQINPNLVGNTNNVPKATQAISSSAVPPVLQEKMKKILAAANMKKRR